MTASRPASRSPAGAAGRPLADELRDDRVTPLLPAVAVCDAQGQLVDADPAARALLPAPDRSPAWLAGLLASARPALSESAGAASAVHAREPDVEGLAAPATLGDRRLIVLHLRDARSSPAAQDMAERLRLYEAVLTTGPIFVHVYDRAMNSRWSTASLRPELGYQPTEPMSADENYALVHPDDVPAERIGPERVAAGEPHEQRIRVRNAAGEWRWLALLSVNLLDDPAVGSLVVHSWDVTDEVEHEQEIDASRRRMAALIDTLEEGVAVVGDGVITFANARMTELFPTVGPHEELIGRRAEGLQEVFARSMAEPGAFLESTMRVVREGRAVRGRFVETADGRILEQHFLPIRVGDRETSRVWVYRDVTARLQLERRQERLLRLERTARRTAEEQNQRLRELDELKTAFVATVSHELRTPLSALTSYVDLLLDPDGDPLTDEQRTLAASAQRGARRLARLVDDLLVLAQLQSRSLRIDLTAVDVPAAVREAIEEVRRGAGRELDIAADIRPGPPVRADRGRLLQIVANLLGNAAKFTRDAVRCSARVEGDAWVVEVLDDGPGIPPDELERVFEPFFRGLGAVAAERPGTGLGLPISSQLAELLGGALTLENRPEGGVRARLVLPVDDHAGTARER